MSTYYRGPGCWFLSDSYKAAYNHILLGPTVALLHPETVTAGHARMLTYLPELNLVGVDLSRVMFDCLLAQALADEQICPRICREDGSMMALCWHRVNHIPTACAGITNVDIANVQHWLRKITQFR